MANIRGPAHCGRIAPGREIYGSSIVFVDLVAPEVNPTDLVGHRFALASADLSVCDHGTIRCGEFTIEGASWNADRTKIGALLGAPLRTIVVAAATGDYLYLAEELHAWRLERDLQDAPNRLARMLAEANAAGGDYYPPDPIHDLVKARDAVLAKHAALLARARDDGPNPIDAAGLENLRRFVGDCANILELAFSPDSGAADGATPCCCGARFRGTTCPNCGCKPPCSGMHVMRPDGTENFYKCECGARLPRQEVLARCVNVEPCPSPHPPVARGSCARCGHPSGVHHITSPTFHFKETGKQRVKAVVYPQGIPGLGLKPGGVVYEDPSHHGPPLCLNTDSWKIQSVGSVEVIDRPSVDEPLFFSVNRSVRTDELAGFSVKDIERDFEEAKRALHETFLASAYAQTVIAPRLMNDDEAEKIGDYLRDKFGEPKADPYVEARIRRLEDSHSDPRCVSTVGEATRIAREQLAKHRELAGLHAATADKIEAALAECGEPGGES